jgi:choline transport protein
MFVITVTVLAEAQPKQSAKFVFTDFENFSGWENNVIAFITGFINANYSFSCLDAATHISEEIPHPERNIPKALLMIPVIGVLSSLFYNISMVTPHFLGLVDGEIFSIGDYDAVVGTATGNPPLELYFEALQNVGGAIFLQCMFLCTGFLCLVSIHTWQSRMV